MAAFDPDAYLAERAGAAPAFDPDAYLAEKAPGRPETGSMEALGRGAAQGATLGFGDEIQGGVQAVLGKVLLGDKRPLPEAYRAERDAARGDNTKAQQDHGFLYGTGTVLGGVAPAVLAPTVKAAQGAGLAARLGTAALNGAPVGAAYGAGTSNADTGGGLAQDAAVGGVLGAAAGVAGQAVGEGLAGTAQKLKDYAGGAAYRQLGGSKITIKSPLNGSGVLGGEAKARDAALAMQDLKVLGPLTRPREALEKLQVEKHVVGSELGNVLPSLDQKLVQAGRHADPAVTVDVGDVLNEVQTKILDPLRKSGVKELEAAAGEVEDQALKLAGLANPNGTMPLARAHQFRRDLDSVLFRNQKNPLMSTVANEKKFGLRDILDDEMAKKVEAAGQAVGGGTEGQDWARLNSLYQSLKIAEKAAEQGARSAAGNSAIGLRDVTLAAGGLASGNPMAALEAAAAAKGLRTYGPGVSAWAARKGSNVLGPMADTLGPATARGATPTANALLTGGAGTPALQFAPGGLAAARGGSQPTGPALQGLGSSTSPFPATDPDPAEHFRRWFTDPVYQNQAGDGSKR